jgi:hypothetical protein
MKKNLLFMMLLLMVVMPAVMPATTVWDGMKGSVGQVLGIVLTLFGVPLILKLGKKLGLTIDEQLASDAIQALINIIVNIDLGKGNADGAAKKKMAVITANNTLTNAQKDVLIMKYGSLEAAVQVAFERSSLNK